MTVASFIAIQRTDHGVPHVLSCRALGVPSSTFYKPGSTDACGVLRAAYPRRMPSERG